jgi:hypothetical protein
MSLDELFPENDYRFSMRFERGTPAGYFAATSENPEILAERHRWLTETPSLYTGMLPEGNPVLDEAVQLAGSWGVLRAEGFIQDHNNPPETCRRLGMVLEPDFVLLKRGSGESFRVVGGAVCFPSHWSLAEKLGRPMADVHSVVPGLNPALGKQIDTFLGKLRPDVAWLRSNWGLARTSQLNDHPSRALPRLSPEVGLNDVWVRLEHQALIALPHSEGLLFGIRVELIPLETLRGNPAHAKGLARALETMPENLAQYKGLAQARLTLLSLLKA